MPDFFDRIVKSGASMAPDAIPPLVYSSGKKNNIEVWKSETDTRAKLSSVLDRTIGAVYLSYHLAKLKPVFFVGQGARQRFNLTPDQLRRGLDLLEKKGVIRSVERTKGRYRRITIL